MRKEYQIKNVDGVVVGRFQLESDRDTGFDLYIQEGKQGYKAEEMVI